MTLPTDDLIVAYVYGELRGEEASAFEARLEEDADLRAEVEGLMAARELLDLDKDNAEKFGFDEPPAHLFESIMNAEPLVRPREMTAAAAAVERPQLGAEPTWFHRMRMWIVGGGAALTAAAALMLMVRTGADEAAPTAAMPESPAQSAKADAPLERANEEAKELKLDEKSGGEKSELAKTATKLALDPAEAAPEPEPTPDEAAEGDAVLDLEAKRGGRDYARRSRVSSGDFADKLGKADEADERKANKKMAEDVLDFRNRAQLAAEPKPTATPRSEAEEQRQPPADLADDESDRDDDFGFAPKAEPAPAPPPPPARAPVVADQGFSVGTTSSGPAGGGSASGAGVKAKDKGVVKFQDAMRERARKAPAKPAPKKKARPVTRSTTTTPESVEALKQSARADKDQEKAQMAFASAELALRQGKVVEAFGLYERAEVLDMRVRKLGLGPRVGKMKALRLLDRCKEVMPLAGALEKAPLKKPHVVEGLFVAAACAEQLGDDTRAENIYVRLYGFPPAQKAAGPSLRRVRQKRMDFDAPAAAESADER